MVLFVQPFQELIPSIIEDIKKVTSETIPGYLWGTYRKKYHLPSEYANCAFIDINILSLEKYNISFSFDDYTHKYQMKINGPCIEEIYCSTQLHTCIQYAIKQKYVTKYVIVSET